MATQSIVGDKSLAFAKRTAKCYRYLKDKKKETVMSKQLCEKMSKIYLLITYWLEVIHSADYFSDEEYKSLKDDNDELLKLLTSIIKTTKDNS